MVPHDRIPVGIARGTTAGLPGRAAETRCGRPPCGDGTIGAVGVGGTQTRETV